ncbi:MAG TPA: hypothetical protein PKE65_05785 [Rhizobiaceae bacterium]|nr:hypothetical protein [Rhizobiaceae bacterium]
MPEGLLAAIENAAPAAFLRASFIAYPLVSAGHVLFIGMLLTAAGLIDLKLLFPRWSVGARLDDAALRPIALLGACGAVVTGLALFSVKASDYGELGVFRLKMTLVALAGANFVLFVSFRGRPDAARRGKFHAAASLSLWLGVLVCGRFTGFF